MRVQKRVAQYINDMGIKQINICEKTGISTSAMSAILTNRRKMTADEFEKICIAIQKSPNDFMKLKAEEAQ